MSFPLCSNERVRDALNKVLLSRRVPHSLLIEGNPGTGKRTLARYIAKTLLCEEENAPCDLCRSCHLADVGTHPDIEIIGPEESKKNISTAQIDRLREIAHLTPRTASGKVLIIEQADTMNTPSQNKLLKVLEEPPANVYFILLASSKSALLDTVISRCTVYSLSEPDFNSALAIMTDRGYDSDKAAEFLALNKNNIGKTLEAFDSSKISEGILIARDYFEAIKRKDKLSSLTVTIPLEKKRSEADVFIKELKTLLAEAVKKSKRLPATKYEYVKMYDAVCEMEPLLITNINIPLFFTALTSKLIAIIN